MKKIDLLLIMLFFAGILPAVLRADQQTNEKVLNEVWQEVARTHYRKDFDTVYRKKVYEKHRSGILQSQTVDELTANLNKMLEDIGDSHLFVLGKGEPTPRFRPVENPGPADLPADPGFTVLGNGRELLVWNVRPDSAADKAGIQAGDILLELEGWPCAVNRKNAMQTNIIAKSLLERGGKDSVCEVKIRSRAAQKVRTLRLKRSIHGGKWFQTAGLPPMVLRYETKMLAPETGYLRFNIFAPEVVKNFRKDRRHGVLKDARNLIIDLRGNPGGILLTAEWLGAWCFPEKLPMGTLIMDGVKLTPVTEPQKGCFNGRVIVLTDGDSASTSELFAAAVQDNKAGTVIGSRTPGKCLPSLFLDLPCGFRVQTVSGDARRPSGKGIERIGVTPDILIENSFDGQGRDRVLAEALQILAKEEK